MTRLPAFERDPRCRTLRTTVVASGRDADQVWVELEDTILYPEGGGQPADRGTIGGVEVLDVRRTEGAIHHLLAGAAPDGTVEVELDWDRRFDHMQQHSGQHLLTAVADARFGWATTAFHLGNEVCDIELDTPSISSDDLHRLEEAVASEIRAARPITARRVSEAEYAGLPVRTRGLPEGHAGDIRIVDIDGIDLNTCGGTHCDSTAELEVLKLLGTDGVRGGTRLYYVTGGRVRRILGAHHERNARLRHLLGVSDAELVDAVEAKLSRLKEDHRTIQELESVLAVAVAEGLASTPDPLCVGHWPDRGLAFLQAVAKELTRRAPAHAAFLTCGSDEEGSFVISAGEASAVEPGALGAGVAEILGGRGGGAGRVFQGRAARLSRRGEAEAFLRAEAGPHDAEP